MNTTAQSGNWNASARWTGGLAGTFPNAIDATATLTQPLSTAPSGVYNVQISGTPGQAITIGGLTVNNSSASTGNLRIGGNGDGTITFQSSSGPAFYTENAYPSEPTSGVFTTNIFARVTFASDTVITQNHALNDNGGTAFTSNANSGGGVTAAPGITVTKAGAGNVEFDVAPTAPATGFQGAGHQQRSRSRHCRRVSKRLVDHGQQRRPVPVGRESCQLESRTQRRFEPERQR